MTNHLTGELLTASIDNRVLRYMLLPFGESNPGFTNLGKVIASKGAVDFSGAVGRSVNLEHDFKRPVGKFTSIEETDEGLVATVSIAATSEGNDALVLAAEGLRTGISVELTNPVIRAGRIISATLDAAGLVTKPAFANAQLMASDHGDLENALDALTEAVAVVREQISEEAPADEETATPEEDSSEPTEPEAENADAPAEADPFEKKDLHMSTNAAVPTALAAGNSGFAPADLKSATALIAQAYDNADTQLAAALERTGVVGSTGLFAALANVSEKDNPTQAAWLGELWTGKSYVRKYASLVNTGSLTSRKVEGWRFVTTPEVDDYAGFPNEIPTNTVTTEAYSETSQMIAGGWKIDRSHADFGDTEFLNSFFRAATEDYARKSDLKVLSKIVSTAVAVTGGAAPEGVNAGIAKIIDGVLSMVDFATPSFALVAPDVYRSILLTRSDDSLAYLSSALGFEDGTVGSFRLVPSPELAPGTVIVGAKEAITFYELPSTPIRVSALDISHNGSDEAIFGYFAIVVNNAKGLVKVS